MLLAIPASPSMRAHPKISVPKRVAAKMIDLFLVLLLPRVLYPVGPLLGFIYSLCADGAHIGALEGQSLGKKVVKLRVMNVKRNAACSLRDSALRNAPVGVATFFGLIPVWGWLIAVLIGLP